MRRTGVVMNGRKRRTDEAVATKDAARREGVAFLYMTIRMGLRAADLVRGGCTRRQVMREIGIDAAGLADALVLAAKEPTGLFVSEPMMTLEEALIACGRRRMRA
jgi:hypothetical protein